MQSGIAVSIKDTCSAFLGFIDSAISHINMGNYDSTIKCLLQHKKKKKNSPRMRSEVM